MISGFCVVSARGKTVRRLSDRYISLSTTLFKASKLIPVSPLFCSNNLWPILEDPPNMEPSITLMELLDKSLKTEAYHNTVVIKFPYNNHPKISGQTEKTQIRLC